MFYSMLAVCSFVQGILNAEKNQVVFVQLSTTRLNNFNFVCMIKEMKLFLLYNQPYGRKSFIRKVAHIITP